MFSKDATKQQRSHMGPEAPFWSPYIVELPKTKGNPICSGFYVMNQIVKTNMSTISISRGTFGVCKRVPDTKCHPHGFIAT